GLVVAPDVDALAAVEERLDDLEVLGVELGRAVADDPELTRPGQRLLELGRRRRLVEPAIDAEPFFLERALGQLEVEAFAGVEVQDRDGLALEGAVDGEV